MTGEKEKTARSSSVGADEGQSIPETDTIIPEEDEEINDFDESDEEFFKRMQPYYLDTISHKELLVTVFWFPPCNHRRLALQRAVYHSGFSEDRQELSDGAAGVPCQHRQAAVGLQCQAGNGAVSRAGGRPQASAIAALPYVRNGR